MTEEAREWMEELGAEAHLPEDWWRAQLPIIASRQQVTTMLDCQDIGPSGRLALRCQYRTGARPTELLALTVREGKLFAGERQLCVDRETLEMLRASPIEGNMTELEGWFQTAAGSVGLTASFQASGRNLTSHFLRHAFASHALEAGMDLISLFYQMGHRHITTTQMYLGTAVNFYRAAYQQHHPLCNPTRGGSLQCKLTVPEALGLLEAPGTQRTRLILRTLYATGMRNDEIRSLLCADVNAAEGRLFLRDAKGPSDMVALVDPVTARQLQEFIAGRPLHEPVFPNLKSAMSVWSIVKKAAQTTGIWEKYTGQGLSLSPHSFRHAYATHCYQNGMDPDILSRLMGHWDHQSTLTYAACQVDYLNRIYGQTHPLSEFVQRAGPNETTLFPM